MRRRFLILMALAGSVAAHAEQRVSHDDFAKVIYAEMADNVRDEYDSAILSSSKYEAGTPEDKLQRYRESLKILFYNKAALFAFCAADAEDARSPDEPRVPARDNVALTKCVEEKFAELDGFANKLNYAGVFFPERIVRCGEESRLQDRERLLPPYEFLSLKTPRLYDFSRYNKCLMQSD